VFMQGQAAPNNDDKQAAMAMFVELRGRLGHYLASNAEQTEQGGGP
jgi:hypothetical protein